VAARRRSTEPAGLHIDVQRHRILFPPHSQEQIHPTVGCVVNALHVWCPARVAQSLQLRNDPPRLLESRRSRVLPPALCCMVVNHDTDVTVVEGSARDVARLVPTDHPWLPNRPDRAAHFVKRHFEDDGFGIGHVEPVYPPRNGQRSAGSRSDYLVNAT